MPIPVFPIQLDDPRMQGYYDGLAAGELRLSVDSATGAFAWYTPEVIRGRPAAAIEWRAVSPEGSAYSFTTVMRSFLPGDHAHEVPYTVILFEPDEAPGCRVPGVLVDAEGVTPACGMRLRFRPVAAGDHWIAGFAPAAD